jgi:hypothetical protein
MHNPKLEILGCDIVAFHREYTEYRYLYLIYKEELWGWVDIEILNNEYTYDTNHSYALAGVSQVINKW